MFFLVYQDDRKQSKLSCNNRKRPNRHTLNRASICAKSACAASLERVRPELIDQFGAKKGKKLPIIKEYLLRAINIVDVTGMVLIEQCWRKWDTSSTEAADNFLIDVLFDALLEERYEFVEQLADYAETLTFENESSKRVVCINHAIALRDSGRANEIENVLGQYDWSGYDLKFRIALCILRGEEDEMYKLLPRAVAASELTREQIDGWPLFRNLRGTDRFDEAVESCFETL